MYTFVADELHHAYRFFNGSKLFLIAIKFVLIDQHADCFLLSDMLLLYTTISVLVKKGWDKCPRNGSTSMSLSGKRNSWKSVVRRNICQWRRLLGERLTHT